MKKYRDFDILNLTTARLEMHNLKIWERRNGIQQNIIQKAVQDIERKKLYSKESNQKHSHFSILYINKFDLGLFCNVVKIQPKKIRKVELKELQRQRR